MVIRRLWPRTRLPPSPPIGVGWRFAWPASAIDETITQTVTITDIATTSARGGTIVPFYSGSVLSTFNYTPPANFVGEDTVTYTVSDNVAGQPLTTLAQLPSPSRLSTIHPSSPWPTSCKSMRTKRRSRWWLLLVLALDRWGDRRERAKDYFRCGSDRAEFLCDATDDGGQRQSSDTQLYSSARSQSTLDEWTQQSLAVVARDNGSSQSPNSNMSVLQTVSIDIVPVNDPPIAPTTSATIDEDGELLFTATSLLSGASLDRTGPSMKPRKRW